MGLGSGQPQTWDSRVQDAAGAPRWVQCILAADPQAGGTGQCRLVLADISALQVRFAATGQSGWVSSGCAPLRDRAGEVVGVIATVLDIRERKRVQQESLELLAELQALFAAMAP